MRGALQGRGSGLHLRPLLEPDGRHVRGPHGGARRRGGGARHRDRHGGGDGLAARPASRRRSRRRGAPALRLVPLRLRGAPAALRHRLDPRRRHASSTRGAPPCGRRPRRSSSRARRTRTSTSSTSPASPRSPTPPGRSSSSTTSSRRRSGRARSKLGADCVVYSATKHIDGQGRCLGGVILGSKEFIEKSIHTYLRQTGPALSPFNAWVLLKGLETLTAARRPPDRDRGGCRRRARRTPERDAPDLSRPAGSPAGRARATPDEGRLDACRPRGRRRQGGRLPLPQRAPDRPASRTISAMRRASSPIRRRRPTSASRRRCARRWA